jgi:pyridoxamine 5'-phosphate oxidase
MNPIDKINSDRHSARGLEDSNADICFLALSQNGKPSVRTLVLRDVNEDGFTLFINRTSHKWDVLQENSTAEILLWYTSCQRQYRINGSIHELERSVIEKNWHRRPTGSKYLDHTYETLGPQSSPIDSRETLTGHVAKLKSEQLEDSLTTPPSATGVILRPDTIESLDLNARDRIHDRRLYSRNGTDWEEQILIP